MAQQDQLTWFPMLPIWIPHSSLEVCEMRKMMKYLFAGFLFLISTTLFSATFQTTDSEGNLIYSDTPINKKSKKANIPPTSGSARNDFSSHQTENTDEEKKPTASDIPSEKKAKNPYTVFSIKKPSDQET